MPVVYVVFVWLISPPSPENWILLALPSVFFGGCIAGVAAAFDW